MGSNDVQPEPWDMAWDIRDWPANMTLAIGII